MGKRHIFLYVHMHVLIYIYIILYVIYNMNNIYIQLWDNHRTKRRLFRQTMFDYPRVYRGSREQIEATSQHPYQKWLLLALRFFLFVSQGLRVWVKMDFLMRKKCKFFLLFYHEEIETFQGCKPANMDGICLLQHAKMGPLGPRILTSGMAEIM